MRLLSVKDRSAREFYENQAIHGGWSVRELDRQIISLLYDRTGRSGDAAGVPNGGSLNRAEVEVAPKHTVKDSSVLAFLDLDDENSESDLKDVLIRRLETFLLELGVDFCFMGRQRRLRIGNEWYRVDLLFFHRRLRCLVVIDLKIGRFTHADAGQMHLYLNYAREHWVHNGENPPVGLILCAQKDEAVARYALDGLPNKVMAAEYRTTLPDEDLLASEIDRTREALGARGLLSEKKAKTGPTTQRANVRQERHKRNS
jgi:predicted nuclease of restriction endonuclease-like (RecB) superfamily